MFVSPGCLQFLWTKHRYYVVYKKDRLSSNLFLVKSIELYLFYWKTYILIFFYMKFFINTDHSNKKYTKISIYFDFYLSGSQNTALPVGFFTLSLFFVTSFHQK
jgi:hypothetical protein